ncbi:MAG: hypothetical protein JWO38_1802 [Gemmataceae bacterium]|nr:hypothetical protein [Gemmataceae bacterium]
MSAYRVCLTVLMLLSAAGPVARAQHPETTFTAVARTHFPKWVKGNADGTLTPERVDALVNDRRITGDEAAAVAAIHVYFRGQKAPAPLGETALLTAARRGGPDERRDQATRPVQLEKVFAAFRGHVRSVPRELFAGDAPQRPGVKQGRLGDCYVVSAVGALATHHPGRLKEMFHPHPDGSCEVAFPGRPPVRVPRLTDAQIALGSGAGAQGLWLNVLEEAVALASRPAGGPTVAMDAISRGGNAGRTIELLTGHRSTTLRFRPPGAKDRPPPADRVPVLAGEVRTVLRAVRDHKILACVATPHEGKLPPGIASAHDFGILGYDPEADTVTLWNPWGNTFGPAGAAGPKHGYPTKKGRFTMPVDEFVRVFGVLFYETDAPAPGR